MTAAGCAARAGRALALMRRHGDSDYLGERVSKNVHARQCGALALRHTGGDQRLALAAFFHDIGHLVGQDRGAETMTAGDGCHLGSSNHGQLGAQYLLSLGFDKGMADLVEGHVDAKRVGHSELSWASKETLKLQGGPMDQQEADQFRARPDFLQVIQLRKWDELAKDPEWIGDTLPSLDEFEQMAVKYLESLLPM